MADPKGFMKIARKLAGNRPIHERVADFSEVEQVLNSEDRALQASRCMDCGIPFCHWGCPVDNLIPEWNDKLYKGDWKAAIDLLQSTNNFPEFTGRICPAPCEHSCVLNIGEEPVTIRENEVAIVEKAFSEGYIQPQPPLKRTGKTVAVIGSGPAGMAAADLLNKAGHTVTLFEKDEKAGGLLRFGIPDFKLNKCTIDRRIHLMEQEGIVVKCNMEIGKDMTSEDLIKSFDAVCLTIGAMQPRDLIVPGRNLDGVHYAMDFLAQQNRVVAGTKVPYDTRISAEGRNVLVIGGGDTGSDCVGTSIRQKAKSVTQIEILPQPPDKRAKDNPWPYYGKIMKSSTSHQEGCTRRWSLSTVQFNGVQERVVSAELETVDWEKVNGSFSMKAVPGSKEIIEADLVLLAMGFVHPVIEGLVTNMGLDLSERKNIKVSSNHQTNVKNVFAAGDAIIGASLVVRAIASGRKVAKSVDDFLRG
ncbi:MAG: glutamate synthase subunit beta [Bacteroidales bacterium]|jgi:glutamate synthase (NADPH/NADH) small chain|nr:glutamate synthase subunit beta [Bacteroidales bacterium]